CRRNTTLVRRLARRRITAAASLRKAAALAVHGLHLRIDRVGIGWLWKRLRRPRERAVTPERPYRDRDGTESRPSACSRNDAGRRRGGQSPRRPVQPPPRICVHASKPLRRAAAEPESTVVG